MLSVLFLETNFHPRVLALQLVVSMPISGMGEPLQWEETWLGSTGAVVKTSVWLCSHSIGKTNLRLLPSL